MASNTTFDLSTICNQRKREQLLNFPQNRLELIESPYKTTNFSIEQLNMKRKATILKYKGKDKNELTQKQQWALLNSQPNSKTIFTTRTIELLYDRDLAAYITYITPPYVDYTTCPNSNSIIKTTTDKSDVPGPIIELYDDPSVPLHMFNDERVYGIENTNEVINTQFVFNYDQYIPQNSNNQFLIQHILVDPDPSVPLKTFNIKVPISVFYSATTKSYAEVNDPNARTGSHYYFSPINILITDIRVSLIYNDITYNSGFNINTDNIVTANSFDISFVKITETDTVTASKYIGYIEIQNVSLPTEPGFIYDYKIATTINSSSISDTNLTIFFENINIGIITCPSNSNRIIQQNIYFTDGYTPPDTIPILQANINGISNHKSLIRPINDINIVQKVTYKPPIDFIINNKLLTKYIKVHIDKYKRIVLRNTESSDSSDPIAPKYIEPLQYEYGRKYYLTIGTYYLVGIPKQYPIAVLNNNKTALIDVQTNNPLIAKIADPSLYANYEAQVYDYPGVGVSGTDNDGVYTFYTGGIKLVVTGDFETVSLFTLNNGNLNGSTINILQYYDSNKPFQETTNIKCLYQSQDNIINVINQNGNKYIFNDQTYYDENCLIATCVGRYRIINIPIEHPLGFEINNANAQSSFYINPNYIPYATSNNINYYVGTVEFVVTADFGSISFKCLRHGYMGGQNKLIFNRSCPTTLLGTDYLSIPFSETIQCLHIVTQDAQTNQDITNIISVEDFDGNKFIFNDISFASNNKIGLNIGTYKFTIPSSHPIGFDISINGTIDISGSVAHLTPLSNSYLKNSVQHYTGEVTMKINSPFEDFSYHCYNHGYMGGENRMTFSSSCPDLGGVSVSRTITADSNTTYTSATTTTTSSNTGTSSGGTSSGSTSSGSTSSGSTSSGSTSSGGSYSGTTGSSSDTTGSSSGTTGSSSDTTGSSSGTTGSSSGTTGSSSGTTGSSSGSSYGSYSY